MEKETLPNLETVDRKTKSERLGRSDSRGSDKSEHRLYSKSVSY